MGAIILGKIHLRWCDKCNVPVLEEDECGICAEKTREVRVTPPGDARPAFDADLKRIRQLIDYQFGIGTSYRVIPEGRIVLLNKAPDIDRMDEVILDGEVVGAVRFGLVSGDKFLLRPPSARALAEHAKKGWVKVDSTAAEAVRKKSASTLAVGILDCDRDLMPGMEVLVVESNGSPVSVGVSKMTSAEMMAHKRGTAVKTRWVVDQGKSQSSGKPAAWDDVIAANRQVISRRVAEATQFIRRMATKSSLPIAVSYSGGKDSLATLLLVLDAGLRPKLLFVDTGLEFEETKRNVEKIASKMSLDLVVGRAGDAFWRNLDYFGPPAKDFRWCCKTCKLGPATQLIQKHFPDGVLSFIGQRAYESQQRAEKGRVWRNPWTPNQLAASPIQKWSALHIWIYLFSKGADVNPLYSRGLERIGCYMCPATDLAELRKVREISPEYSRWQRYLDEYAKRTSRSDAWLKYDLWRWRNVPESVLEELGSRWTDEGGHVLEVAERSNLEFRSTSGYSPCVEGLSMEGVFSRPLPMKMVANMLNIIGEVTTSPDGSIAEVRSITVFREGPVMIKARDEKELRDKAVMLKDIVFRAVECAGCGICLGRCKNGALELNGRIVVNATRCTHCGECLGPCPAVRFREEEMGI